MYHNSYERLAYLVDTYGPRLWVTLFIYLKNFQI